MIEKLIENWLIKASEKSYQLPFCYLLMNDAKTVLHMTSHNSMEHGKDVLAVDSSGQVYAYQLKGVEGGRLTISKWQEIINQVFQLVLTPVNHPSLSANRVYHRSFLVVNGDIQEDVQHAISQINQEWINKGQSQYRIETIVKGQLLEMAFKAKDMFLPSEITDFKALLEFQLDDGTAMLDKGKFSSLLQNLFNSTDETNDKKFRRAVTSTALLCSLALKNYSQNSNHWALIEGWSVFIFSILYQIEKSKRKVEDFDSEIQLAQQQIIKSASDLFHEVKLRPDLINGEPFVDVFVLKHRTIIIIGIVSFLGIINPNSNKGEILRFIEKHVNDAVIWGESAIPFALALHFFLKSANLKADADLQLKSLIETVVNAISSNEIFFPDVYVSPEEAIASNLPTKPTESDKPSKRIGYVLESLVALCSHLDFFDTIQKLWPEISRCIFSSVEFDDPEDFYTWRSEKGIHVNRYPNVTQSWAELLKSRDSFAVEKIPIGILKYKEWLPLYLMVYPHRINSNIVKWYIN